MTILLPDSPDTAPAGSPARDRDRGPLLLAATDADRGMARARLAAFRAAVRKVRPDLELRLSSVPGAAAVISCALPATEPAEPFLHLARRHGLVPVSR